jgi:hypothetical protein
VKIYLRGAAPSRLTAAKEKLQPAGKMWSRGHADVQEAAGAGVQVLAALARVAGVDDRREGSCKAAGFRAGQRRVRRRRWRGESLEPPRSPGRDAAGAWGGTAVMSAA